MSLLFAPNAKRNTNLLCARCHQERDHSIKPYQCQNKASCGEEADEESLKTGLIGEFADSLVQSGNVDRKSWVERGNLRANPARSLIGRQ
jgi:hypothetical protein